MWWYYVDCYYYHHMQVNFDVMDHSQRSDWFMRKLRVLFYAVCLMFLFESTTFAYIDPSVMTYTIQIIAGAAIAIGAVVGVIVRNAKKKAQKILKIDENAKKEVEGEVIEINPDADKDKWLINLMSFAFLYK